VYLGQTAVHYIAAGDSVTLQPLDQLESRASESDADLTILSLPRSFSHREDAQQYHCTFATASNTNYLNAPTTFFTSSKISLDCTSFFIAL